MNKRGCVPIKLYLLTLEFEIYTVFMCHDILCFISFFPQQFKNVKPIHSLRAIQKQHSPELISRLSFMDPQYRW